MAATEYSIVDFGAVGDGTTKCTQPLQAALDAAGAAGGGKVVVPAGVYMTGTFHLRSNVCLEIQTGATLLGSPDIADYPAVGVRDHDRHCHHLLMAEGLQNVTICGGGTIDGNGPAFWKEPKGPRTWIGAKSPRVSPMIEIVRCQDVRIENITITNSPGWTLHPFWCDRLWIRGVKLLNPLFGPNTDGIDLNSCRDVMISDCFIECGDDAIVLKTTPDGRSQERITVTNCVIRTHCVGLKLGANESYHDQRQITFSNCVVYKSTRAVGLYNWRGSVQEDIAISNVVCDTDCGFILNRPIHVDLRCEDGAAPGTLRNVQVSNFIARTDGRILITAADGCRIQNLVLRDIQMNYPMIDDPEPVADAAGSAQFSNHSREARRARAAIVVDTAENLVVDGLLITWPTEGSAAGWSSETRIENGGERQIPPAAQQPPFHVVWARNVRGGRLHAPLARPSADGVDRYALQDCDVDTD